MSEDELNEERIFLNTKEIEVNCNLLETSDGNLGRTLETFVTTRYVSSVPNGMFQRFNTRMLNPKYHRMIFNEVKEINIQIKDRHSGKLLKLDSGEVIATLHFKASAKNDNTSF